ncbi:MAG: hypothetical protein OZSIB_3139 [Candidatus Ozemobacter sibiricus]|jgi:pimeloyl-ACP methyl ester carboxylesterase|uniref:Serine aminopeptidase S33 domain-containing protein n=1 Tax=Candidatus Ozemobacter sibiricus TaxID=2268124 RepID=A0A367ZQK5_9BACT|nr:MAG: hypothetical protein OZSIB_3139 [Candidatus Ozemobacter sibiricus]
MGQPALWMKAWLVLRSLVAVVVVLAALLYLGQNRVIFFPIRLPGPPPLPPVHGQIWQDVMFPTADGSLLHGVYVSIASSTGPGAGVRSNDAPVARHVLLYSHGNAGHLGMRFPRIAALVATLPLDVFIYDYRGFGASQGRPTVAGAVEDGEAALRWLHTQRGVEPERVILFGESLGTGIATALAAPRLDRIAGLVLESGFRSLSWRAGRRFPLIGPLVLSRDLPSTGILSGYHGPLLVIHSRDDEVIPFADGEALLAAAPTSSKHHLWLDGVGHNDPVWELPAYIEAWRGFLTHVATAAGMRGRP